MAYQIRTTGVRHFADHYRRNGKTADTRPDMGARKVKAILEADRASNTVREFREELRQALARAQGK